MSKVCGELDERAVVVENAAGRLAYLVMSWLLVIDMLVRARFPHWVDLNGFPTDIVVILAAGALTWFWVNWRASTFTRRRLVQMGLSSLVSAIIAGALAWWLL